MSESPFWKPYLPRHYHSWSEPADEFGEETLHFVSELKRLQLRGHAFREFEQLVLPLLDGEHSFAQIARQVAGTFAEKDLAACLGLLASEKILQEGDARAFDDVARRIVPQVAFFHEITGQAKLLQETLTSAQVTIFGLGGAGAMAAASLAAAGVGRLRCFDPTPVRETDLYLSPLFKVGDVGTSRAAVVASAIRERAPQVKVAAYCAPLHEDQEIQSLIQGSDLVLSCLSSSQSNLILQLNRICLKTGICWIPCTLSGTEIILGPTVRPFDGPCYVCYRMRAIACSKDPQTAKAYLRYLERRKQDDTGARENLVFGAGIAANLLGLEAIKELTGIIKPPASGQITIFNLLDLSSSKHVVLPRPFCPVCGQDSRSSEFAAAIGQPSPVKGHSSSHQLEALVSDRTGIIKSLSRVNRAIEEPDPPVIYQTILSHFDLQKRDESERAACGKGQTAGEAAIGAIAEAVERYCASHVDPRKICTASWSAIEKEGGIAPPDFVLYSPSQYRQNAFPYPPWNPNTEVRWITARELPSDKRVLVPASFVFLSRLGCEAEDCFCRTTSNGLAAGTTIESAVLHGLCELIERDGFMIHWMNRLPGTEIQLPANERPASSIVAWYRERGIEVRFFNLSTDLPGYVIMSLAITNSGEGPAVVCGLGCHLDPRLALQKSLFEVCQVYPGEKLRFQKERPSERLKNYQDVRSINDHSAFLTDPDRLDEFDFLLKTRRQQRLADLPSQSTGSPQSDLHNCTERMAYFGYRTCYVDITTSDVLSCGMQVVRVLVTGLQPIHFGFGMERLGGNRLFSVPRTLGLSTEVRSESDLNRCPHPLA
jgi:ribosomal protein S12 methylthiotransferase accessory factor